MSRRLRPFTPAIVIRNTRPGLDRNTCGQAAIATLLRVHGLADPGSDHEAIDSVLAHHPPDLPFALGTTAWRIAAALSAHGLDVEIVHSGWFGHRLGRARARLYEHLRRELPAAVCLDGGQVGGMPWSAHWAVALWMDVQSIQLGNVPGDGSWSLDRFERAWACRHLPYGHNHAAVLARPPASGSNRPSGTRDRWADATQPRGAANVSSRSC